MTSRRVVHARSAGARVVPGSRNLVAALAPALLGSLLLALLALPSSARADDLRPAYLQLVERADDTWDVSWKVPAIDETTTLAIRPEFPPGTEVVTPARRAWAEGTAMLGWTVRVPGGLAGRTVEIPGLASSRTEVIARIVRRDGSENVIRVSPREPRLSVGVEPSPLEVARTWVRLGVEDVRGRLDQFGVLLSICLLAGDGRRLVATIAAWSLAYSLTLALAVLGLLDVPRPPVEAAIALGIVFLAAGVVRSARDRPSGLERRPWAMALVLGLLQGLGFAATLAEAGVPRASIPTALLAFNLGIEAGQIIVVVGLVALRRLVERLSSRLRWPAVGRIRLGTAYVIGSVASASVFERVAGFWHGG